MRWRTLFERAARLVHEAEAVAEAVRVRDEEPSGTVRVNSTVAYGQVILVPKIATFLRKHPKVRVELSLSDERRRIVDEGFDLTVRMGELEDRNLIMRRLEHEELRLVAAPGLVAEPARARSYHELRDYPGVLHSSFGWTLTAAEVSAAQEIRLDWRLSVDSMLALTQATVEGLGLRVVPAFLCDPLIAVGRLVEIRAEHALQRYAVTALMPRNLFPSAATRALLNELKA